MSSMTAEEIRQALYDNSALPHGAARNAQAEVLTAAAETCGDPELFRLALVSQIDAYEYSAERTRMVVPFARLLQEYDRDPGAFDSNDTYALFWRFKWVSGRIVESPEIPIGSVTRWLDDMERRYRIAGYSERAVRQAEFYLAHAVGDDERAERAVERWQAAERDGMSDCHACETHTQGWFWANKGLDAKAIDIWEPVLVEPAGLQGGTAPGARPVAAPPAPPRPRRRGPRPPPARLPHGAGQGEPAALDR